MSVICGAQAALRSEYRKSNKRTRGTFGARARGGGVSGGNHLFCIFRGMGWGAECEGGEAGEWEKTEGTQDVEAKAAIKWRDRERERKMERLMEYLSREIHKMHIQNYCIYSFEI